MFYVGGNCGNSNVELHDVRFSIGETPEDCHDDLRKQWWGDAESLHLDCWGAVEQADGFDIVLTKDAPQESAGQIVFYQSRRLRPARIQRVAPQRPAGGAGCEGREGEGTDPDQGLVAAAQG